MPNPITETTLIAFTVLEAGEAQLIIRDVSGRVLMDRSLDVIAGRTVVELNRADLGAAGVLTYTLVSGDFVATKQMVLLR